MKQKFSLTKLSILFLSLFTVSCSDQNIGDGNGERPANIIPSEVRIETLARIAALLPERIDLRTSLPQLFEQNTEKRILLTQESEVYVTYVDEGASYENSFGYYTYNINNLPIDTTMIELNLLFPHVNEYILKQGDMLQVGNSKFPAGTVIGFFLIVKGWENKMVNYNKQTIYTDVYLNKGKTQQHVLFKLNNFGDVILGFEDIFENAPGYHDFDFNDIVFTVSDNKDNVEVRKFNLTSVIKL